MQKGVGPAGSQATPPAPQTQSNSRPPACATAAQVSARIGSQARPQASHCASGFVGVHTRSQHRSAGPQLAFSTHP